VDTIEHIILQIWKFWKPSIKVPILIHWKSFIFLSVRRKAKYWMISNSMYIIPFFKLLSSLIHVNLRGNVTQFFHFSTHPVLTGTRTPFVSTPPPLSLAPLFTNYIVHFVSSLTTVFNQFSSFSILCSEDCYYKMLRIPSCTYSHVSLFGIWHTIRLFC
jgi:hypothetical protein